MKIQHFILSFILLSIITRVSAQDIIINSSNQELKCDISKVTPDTLFFTMKIKENNVKTYLEKSKIISYQIEQLENIKANYDSLSYFSIQMEDGTKLFGKIIAINDNIIEFDDNLLNKINLRAENIKSSEKEELNAYYNITLQNDVEIHGKLVARRKTEIDIENESLGKISITSTNIKKMDKIDISKMNNGQYWFPNPNDTRYLFAPTAMNLKQGSGYYQNAYIIGNSINYGLSDNVSVGAIVVLPIAALLTPKMGFKVAEKVHLGAGAIFGILPGPSFAGIFYGVATYGSDDNNITLGSGYGFYDDRFTKWPIITVNGMARISRRIGLVTENWIFPRTNTVYDNYDYTISKEETTYYSLISYGIRFMGQRTTFDFAFINNADIADAIIIGIPYIDFVYRF